MISYEDKPDVLTQLKNIDKWTKEHNKQILQNAVNEMNFIMNLDYYNRFYVLFDADFRITSNLNHKWSDYITVGMMENLYNNIQQ